MMSQKLPMVLWLLISLLWASIDARAAECNDETNPTPGKVGLYIDWPGTDDTASAQYTEEAIRKLSGRFDTIAFCTITKVVFPSLATANLFDVKSVRKTLLDATPLAQGKTFFPLAQGRTFLQKLENRHIEHLIFFQFSIAESPSHAKFMAVQIDHSQIYPDDNFSRPEVQDYSQPPDDLAITQFLYRAGEAIEKRKQVLHVILACFRMTPDESLDRNGI
jgi:hypothetical protein